MDDGVWHTAATAIGRKVGFLEVKLGHGHHTGAAKAQDLEPPLRSACGAAWPWRSSTRHANGVLAARHRAAKGHPLASVLGCARPRRTRAVTCSRFTRREGRFTETRGAARRSAHGSAMRGEVVLGMTKHKKGSALSARRCSA
jgi:hypothetical protein